MIDFESFPHIESALCLMENPLGWFSSEKLKKSLAFFEKKTMILAFVKKSRPVCG